MIKKQPIAVFWIGRFVEILYGGLAGSRKNYRREQIRKRRWKNHRGSSIGNSSEISSVNLVAVDWWGSNPWSNKCLFPSSPTTWWSVTLPSPPVIPPQAMIRSGVILMAPLCALLVNGGREEPPCLDPDWILSHHSSLFLLPGSHPAGSLKVIGLEVSPWGVVALTLSHVGSEAFYTQQKGHNGHAALRKPLFCWLAQSPSAFFFVVVLKASSRKVQLGLHPVWKPHRVSASSIGWEAC